MYTYKTSSFYNNKCLVIVAAFLNDSLLDAHTYPGSGIRDLMLFRVKDFILGLPFCFSLTYNVSGDLSSLMERFSFLCAVSVAGKHCLIPCHFWMLIPWEFASADSRVHSDDV